MLGLLIHVGYNVFAYLTMYYNPALKIVTALPFMACACIHAVLGMCAVFLQGDGTRMDVYGKQNRRTIIQRVSAALIFPLLIVHLKQFDVLQAMAEKGNWIVFAIMILLDVIFFMAVAAHIATSFSRAFITLGMLQDREKAKDIRKTYKHHFGSSCSKALTCMDVCPANIQTIASMARLNRRYK